MYVGLNKHAYAKILMSWYYPMARLFPSAITDGRIMGHHLPPYTSEAFQETPHMNEEYVWLVYLYWY